MESLLQAVEQQYAAGLPFVVYSLPESDQCIALLQKDALDHGDKRFVEPGFVFAPFDDRPGLFLHESACQQVSAQIPTDDVTRFHIPSAATDSEKNNYKELVVRARNFIAEQHASKIVISRCKAVTLYKFDISLLVQRLLALYPTAFRYLWFHPKSGVWCGATPEVLIANEGRTFRTMALAGTLKHDPEHPPRWSQKELNEQRWVTDDLSEKLQKASSILKVSKVHNHVAGSLVHLRTDFTGVLKKREDGLELLARSLHPTPAVCGTPTDVAQSFITNYEGYDRLFYTGFLGPVMGGAGDSQLFVNLRCARIDQEMAHLYVGGGITENSIPSAEFDETEHKLETMLQALYPMLNLPS